MDERDSVQYPLASRPWMDQKGMALEQKGTPSLGEWFEQIAQIMAMGLAMRGGVGNPMIRFPMKKGQKALSRAGTTYPARNDLTMIAGETPDTLAWQGLSGVKASTSINPKTFSLGRHPSKDVIKPGRGAVGETTDPVEVTKLMDVLTSLYELGPGVRRYPW